VVHVPGRGEERARRGRTGFRGCGDGGKHHRAAGREYQNSPLKVFGQHDENTIAQMRNCMSIGNAVAGVICADGHLGYAQPVGGVIAYEKQISISGVGFDIGCGNMAVRWIRLSRTSASLGTIIKDVHKVISFGVGRTNDERVEHALFDDADAWREADREDYRQKAVTQLGTVGSGNHYVDLMRDEEGFVWIGVHFGSRGLGHSSATKYLKAAGGKDGMNVPPAVIDEDSEIGRRYIAAMELAGRYSYAGREWVVERVRKIIGGASPTWCTTTTTTLGARTTAAKTCGWSARAQRRPSPASAALSAARWAMTP
jgi:tRNA-splicing ligase RtcB